MKKIILLALTAVLFTSCYVTEEYHVNSSNWNYTVYPDMWESASDDLLGNYFYCEFPNRELTSYVLQNAMLKSYFFYYTGDFNEDPKLCELPYTDYWVEDDGYKWESEVTVEYGVGIITFILKHDEQDDLMLDKKYSFKVRAMWE